MVQAVGDGEGGDGKPIKKFFMEETNMKKIIATVLAMVMAMALCGLFA